MAVNASKEETSCFEGEEAEGREIAQLAREARSKVGTKRRRDFCFMLGEPPFGLFTHKDGMPLPFIGKNV